MKIKVNEAKGIVLDYLVAKSIGRDAKFKDFEENWVTKDNMSYDPVGDYTPSTDWAQGGPIIEREKIRLDYGFGLNSNKWLASVSLSAGYDFTRHNGDGETALVAAMRCYVASKLGNEVEIPDDFVILA